MEFVQLKRLLGERFSGERMRSTRTLAGDLD
jgi:hypothetical protein